MFRTAAAVIVLLLGFAVVPLYAAEPSTTASSNSTTSAVATAAVTTNPSPLAFDTDWSLPMTRMGDRGAVSRGAILPSLYVSLAALNAYDAFSTRAGLSHGAAEGNTAMSGVAGNSAALFATKAAVTAGTIALSEHLWRTHRKGQAIAAMVISNALMSAVAVHNNAVLHNVSR